MSAEEIENEFVDKKVIRLTLPDAKSKYILENFDLTNVYLNLNLDFNQLSHCQYYSQLFKVLSVKYKLLSIQLIKVVGDIELAINFLKQLSSLFKMQSIEFQSINQTKLTSRALSLKNNYPEIFLTEGIGPLENFRFKIYPFLSLKFLRQPTSQSLINQGIKNLYFEISNSLDSKYFQNFNAQLAQTNTRIQNLHFLGVGVSKYKAKISFSSEIVTALAQNQNIKGLIFDNIDIANDSLSLLCKGIQNNKSLTHISFTNSSISSSSESLIKSIKFSSANFKILKFININFSKVDQILLLQYLDRACKYQRLKQFAIENTHEQFAFEPVTFIKILSQFQSLTSFAFIVPTLKCTQTFLKQLNALIRNNINLRELILSLSNFGDIFDKVQGVRLNYLSLDMKETSFKAIEHLQYKMITQDIIIKKLKLSGFKEDSCCNHSTDMFQKYGKSNLTLQEFQQVNKNLDCLILDNFQNYYIRDSSRLNICKVKNLHIQNRKNVNYLFEQGQDYKKIQKLFFDSCDFINQNYSNYLTTYLKFPQIQRVCLYNQNLKLTDEHKDLINQTISTIKQLPQTVQYLSLPVIESNKLPLKKEYIESLAKAISKLQNLQIFETLNFIDFINFYYQEDQRYEEYLRLREAHLKHEEQKKKKKYYDELLLAYQGYEDEIAQYKPKDYENIDDSIIEVPTEPSLFPKSIKKVVMENRLLDIQPQIMKFVINKNPNILIIERKNL